MKICLALILTILASCSFGINSKETINIALTHIPEVLEYGKPNAPYNRFVQRMLTDLSQDFDFVFEYMPSSRSNKKLVEQSIDCIFPIVPSNSRTIETQLSTRINRISAHIFTLGPDVISDLAQLEGQIVVHQRGYLFGDNILQHKNIHFFPVSNQNAALGMMQKKRAVAFIDYIPDLRFVLSPDELATLKFDKTKPLIQSFDHFECTVDERINRFLKRINQFVIKLNKNGDMERILGKYYVKAD